MACYRISITFSNKPPIIGIKEHSSAMIEVVYNYFKNKAYAHFGESCIKDFDCVMISKQSDSYKKWMDKRTNKKPPEINWGNNPAKG